MKCTKCGKVFASDEAPVIELGLFLSENRYYHMSPCFDELIEENSQNERLNSIACLARTVH